MVHGLDLTIQGGEVAELRSGSFDVTGTIVFGSLTIAEMQLQAQMPPGLIVNPREGSRGVSQSSSELQLT